MKISNLLCTVLIGGVLIFPQSRATEVESEAGLPKRKAVVPPSVPLTSSSAPALLRIRLGKSTLNPGEVLRPRPGNTEIFEGKEPFTIPGDPRAYLRDKAPAVKESGSEG